MGGRAGVGDRDGGGRTRRGRFVRRGDVALVRFDRRHVRRRRRAQDRRQSLSVAPRAASVGDDRRVVQDRRPEQPQRAAAAGRSERGRAHGGVRLPRHALGSMLAVQPGQQQVGEHRPPVGGPTA